MYFKHLRFNNNEKFEKIIPDTTEIVKEIGVELIVEYLHTAYLKKFQL